MDQDQSIKNTAILLIVFNRPESTKEVIGKISKIKPSKLYVAADGPRNTNESKKTMAVRDLFDDISWPCEINRLYSDKNLGCKDGPIKAINWFFSLEEQGIILEDDCKPDISFFHYCDWALNKYRDEKSVWHLNGSNFLAPQSIFKNDEYSFTSLAQVWGWATWRDRWSEYEACPFKLQLETSDKWLKWKLPLISRFKKYQHLEKLKSGLDAWDYQWQITILNNNGLVLVSNSNLISNIGDDDDATHTSGDSRARLQTSAFRVPKSNVSLSLNNRLTKWYSNRMGLNFTLGSLVKFVSYSRVTLVNKFLHRIGSYLIPNKKIVIASTGRSGSTMLYRSVAYSLLIDRFPILSRLERKYVEKTAMRLFSCFTDRLAIVSKTSCVVQKTHDVFDSKYSRSAKYIFVYGDPLDSAFSVEKMTKANGMEWFEEHLYHLASSGDYSDLFKKDVLNYEFQCESWSNTEGDNILRVNYNNIWSEESKISSFIGCSLLLPKKVKRETKVSGKEFINHDLFEKLRIKMKLLK